MAKSKTIQKTVAWFLVEKEPPMIKFQEDDDAFEVGSNVIEKSNFEKYPINKEDVVSVIISDGEVVYLRKLKKQNTKKQSSSSNKEEKTVTTKIEAVSKNKEVVMLEKDGDWIPVSDKVKEMDYEKIGLVRGNTVTVTLKDGKVTYVKKGIQTSTSNSKKSSGNYRDEVSTDKRTALMVAKDIVVKLIETEKLDKSKISTAMNDLTTDVYDALKNLK